MGWFWRSTSNSNSGPADQLEPGLRDYLKQQAPSEYQPVAAPEPQPQPQPAQPPQQSAESSRPPAPSVPSASLFPDGRYADLWKNYVPPNQGEASTAPAERVIDQFKQRKETLNQAALENCSEEQMALALCFKTGTLKDRTWARMTLCDSQNKSFARCYTMQTKFLQALGYGSRFEIDADREERIQMHADKLYHQMLDYERRVDEAKAAGQQPPPLQSLFNPAAPVEPAESSTQRPDFIPGGERLPEGARPSKSLENMTPHEREVEVRVWRQKMEEQGMYRGEVSDMLKGEEAAKLKRREKFSSWFGPTIGNWLA